MTDKEAAEVLRANVCSINGLPGVADEALIHAINRLSQDPVPDPVPDAPTGDLVSLEAVRSLMDDHLHMGGRPAAFDLRCRRAELRFWAFLEALNALPRATSVEEVGRRADAMNIKFIEAGPGERISQALAALLAEVES